MVSDNEDLLKKDIGNIWDSGRCNSEISKNAAMAQKALFKRELGLDDSRIMTYSVTQNTMRSELIGRIMTALEGHY